MGVVGQPSASAEDIRCMTRGSIQPSQQKPGIKDDTFQERSVGDSNDVSLCDIQRRPIRPWRMLYRQKCCQLELKRTEAMK